MKKLLTASTLILAATFTVNSQAGWLDGIVGSKKESAPAEEQKARSTEQNSVSNATVATASGQSLVDLISSQVGVTNEQATGGLGAIFQAAKSSLSSGEFSTLAAGVPGMDSLLSAAPSGDGGLGGLLAKAGSAGQLMSAFDKLGLTPEQLSSFTSVITDYFTGNDQADLSDLLIKGIGSFI